MKKLLAVILALLTVIPLFAISSYAAPENITPVVFDLMNGTDVGIVADEGDAIRAKKATVDGISCTEFGYGVYSGPWDPPKKALSNYYAVMYLKPNGLNRFGKDTAYKYMTVVYMTHDTEAHPVTVFSSNNWKKSVIVEDASNSNGKFVRSDAVYMGDSAPFNERLVPGKAFAIDYGSKDKNSNFYIKEIAFFKSPTDADKYYEGKFSKVESYNETVVDFTSQSSMDASKARLDYDKSGDTLHASFKNIDGVGCLSLNRGAYTGTSSVAKDNLSNYYTSVVLNDDQLLFDNKFMVVTYMTKDTGKNTLTIFNNANMSQKIDVVKDTSASQGEFVHSEPVDISAFGIASRLKRRLPAYISYSAKEDNAGLFIKEIAFFKTAKEAKEFYAVKNEGVQLTKSATAEAAKTDIRFVASVDSAEYVSAGFVVSTVKDFSSKTFTKEVNNAYSSIMGNKESVSAQNLGNKYLITCVCRDIPNAGFDTPIYCKTFVKMADGTVIYSDVISITVSSLFN